MHCGVAASFRYSENGVDIFEFVGPVWTQLQSDGVREVQAHLFPRVVDADSVYHTFRGRKVHVFEDVGGVGNHGNNLFAGEMGTE